MDTGKAGDDLYPSIAETLRQANISLFIGIGKHLSEHRHDFAANSRFYEDTEHFLRQEERDNFNNQIILIKGARAFQFEYIAGFLQKQSHSTILEVDLDAMVHNLNHFRSLTDAHIAVMVKAFSYGSGSREIASLLQYHRVDYLMVAFADEGIELRAAGITIPIAVMNPEREAFDNMIMFNLEPEIYALDILEDFNRALNKHGIKRFPVHIKLNTGHESFPVSTNRISRTYWNFSKRNAPCTSVPCSPISQEATRPCMTSSHWDKYICSNE